MSVSEISSSVRHDQREISLKASVSDTMTIKLRMNLGQYFFSNIKPVKNYIYSWQVAYFGSFTGDKSGACPDPTHAKNFSPLSVLTYRLLLHTTKSYFRWNSIKKKCMRAGVEKMDRSLQDPSPSLPHDIHIFI